MENYCVYCHIAPNGKMYVGCTVMPPEKRWRNGRGYEKNEELFADIEKFGWDNFAHVIVRDSMRRHDALKLEGTLIDVLELTNPERGYNLRNADGSFSEQSAQRISNSRIGNGNCIGRNVSQETRDRISESLRRYYSVHPSASIGRHHSEETKAKLRGRVFSDETRQLMRVNHANVSGSNNPSARPVAQYTIDGNFIKEYPYASAASKELGIDLSSIIKCCRGKQKTCGGFMWKYVNLDLAD